MALYFISLSCRDRLPLLRAEGDKKLVLCALGETKKKLGVSLVGYTILDDHMHFIIDSTRYTCDVMVKHLRSVSMRLFKERDAQDRAVPLWQARYSARELFSPSDLRAYLDVMHYDPVRHGYVQRPAEYAWSSLRARIRQRQYPKNWAHGGPPPTVMSLLHVSTPSRPSWLGLGKANKVHADTGILTDWQLRSRLVSGAPGSALRTEPPPTYPQGAGRIRSAAEAATATHGAKSILGRRGD